MSRNILTIIKVSCILATDGRMWPILVRRARYGPIPAGIRRVRDLQQPGGPTRRPKIEVRTIRSVRPPRFLAELAQHIHNKGEHLVGYSGGIRTKSRGRRDKQLANGPERQDDTELDPRLMCTSAPAYVFDLAKQTDSGAIQLRTIGR